MPPVHRTITNVTRVSFVPEWRLGCPAAATSKNEEHFIAPVSYKAKFEKLIAHTLVLVVWKMNTERIRKHSKLLRQLISEIHIFLLISDRRSYKHYLSSRMRNKAFIMSNASKKTAPNLP